MRDYDEFQAEVRERKRNWWAKILNYDPPGRAPGRRPRDPEQEFLLLRLSRARLRARQGETAQRPQEGQGGPAES